MNKIIDLNDLKKSIKDRSNKVIVFTNGCFDILHRGHIELLRRAKKLGDILIVGLNSDNSVHLLKGINRPVQNENDRAQILAALEMVDYVLIFDEETPEQVIAEIRPDIQVKGGDWKAEEIPEVKILEEYGGRLEIIPYLPGYSTSQIIDSIRENTTERE